MEDLPKWVQAFIDSRPPWNYVLGGVALAIFLAPKLMELHAGRRTFAWVVGISISRRDA